MTTQKVTTAQHLLNVLSAKWLQKYGMPKFRYVDEGEFRVYNPLMWHDIGDRERLEILFAMPTEFLFDGIAEYDRLTWEDPKNVLILEHRDTGEAMLARNMHCGDCENA